MGKPPAWVTDNRIHAHNMPQVARQRNKVGREYFHRAPKDGHTQY